MLGWVLLAVGFSGCSTPAAPPFPATLVDQRMTELMAQHHVPGVQVCVFTHEEVVYQAARGVADVRDSSRVSLQMPFEAASLSKPVFVYLLDRLQATGSLPDSFLTTPLGELMPWGEDFVPPREPRYRGLAAYTAFRPGYDSLWFSQITPQDLLLHRSGMGNWWDSLPHTLFAPGQRFYYSDDGYVLLQRWVEHRYGASLQTLLNQHLPSSLAPMRLFSPSMAPERLPSGHDPEGNFQREIWRSAEALAHGSLYSSAQDYAAFAQHLARASAFPPPQRRVPVTDSLAWGLGWGLVLTARDTAYWHHGNDTYFQNFVVYSPQRDWGVVVMTNSRHGLALIDDLMPLLWGHQLPATRWARPGG